MCAILDSDVAHQVFTSNNRPPAGEAFFNWLNSGNGLLVAGGQLLEELDKNQKFQTWRKQAEAAGRVRLYNDDEIENKTRGLKDTGSCRSNDTHVVALAQISGARLLFTNDDDLRKDFADKNLIDNPRGKVYTTERKRRSGKRYVTVRIDNFQESHKRLLGNRSLCRRK